MQQSSLVKIVANFETTLATTISVGGTTATLVSQTDRYGNVIPDGQFGFSIAVDSSNLEHIVCTKTGRNLTNIKSVNLQTGAETTGVIFLHNAGERVKITNYVTEKRVLDLFNGVTNFDKEIPLAYTGEVQHTTNIDEFATIRDISAANGINYPVPHTTATASTGNTPATNLTYTATIPSDTGKFLEISIIVNQISSIASVAVDGNAATLIGSKEVISSNIEVLKYYYLPSAAGTATISITTNALADITSIATPWTSVSVGAPIQVAGTGSYGQSLTASDTLTTTALGAVISSVVGYTFDTTCTPNSPQVTLGTSTTAGQPTKLSSSFINSTGVFTATLSSAMGALVDWVTLSVAINGIVTTNGGSGLVDTITQTTHGLSLGDVIGSNNTANQYKKVISDTSDNMPIGFVIDVVDTNTYKMCTGGLTLIDPALLTTFSNGDIIWHSTSVSGAITPTKPGGLTRKLGVVIDKLSGKIYVDIDTGFTNSGGSSVTPIIGNITVNSSTTQTITHNLGTTPRKITFVTSGDSSVYGNAVGAARTQSTGYAAYNGTTITQFYTCAEFVNAGSGQTAQRTYSNSSSINRVSCGNGSSVAINFTATIDTITSTTFTVSFSGTSFSGGASEVIKYIVE